jgi:DNA-binding beta-propeller fold protein YncE
MRRNTYGKSGFWGIRMCGAAVGLLLGLLWLVGVAVPARAVVTQVGPQELLLDPVAGRLYTYLAYDNRILTMDVVSGQLVSVITDVGIPGNRYEGTGIQTLALDEQAGRLFAINSVARGPEGQTWMLFAIDAAQGTIVQQIPLGVSQSPPRRWLLADPAHSKLYAVGEADTVVYDAVTLAEQGTLSGGQWSLLDREGSRLYVVSDESVAVMNTADDTVLAELPRPEGFPYGMAVDPPRGRFYLALEGAIHVLDTTAQEWLDPLTKVPSSIHTLAVDPADGELYIAGREEDGDMMTFYVFVLSPKTGERKTIIAFQEPKAPEGYECGGFLWVTVNKLTPSPAGGRIYGSGNAMSHCRPEAHLAFVLDTEAEALVEWLPRLPVLPETGGRWVGGGWLVLAGLGLLSLGILVYRLHSVQRTSPPA